ncbi:regulatory protein, partial [Streptomyces sparsogenes DSM 40356]
MRDGHRAEIERLLARAVEEEVRRSGGRTHGGMLLGRARAALDSMAATAGEEYGAYLRALEESEADSRPLSSRLTRRRLRAPMLATAVAAAAAFGADLSF